MRVKPFIVIRGTYIPLATSSLGAQPIVFLKRQIFSDSEEYWTKEYWVPEWEGNPGHPPDPPSGWLHHQMEQARGKIHFNEKVYEEARRAGKVFIFNSDNKSNLEGGGPRQLPHTKKFIGFRLFKEDPMANNASDLLGKNWPGMSSKPFTNGQFNNLISEERANAVRGAVSHAIEAEFDRSIADYQSGLLKSAVKNQMELGEALTRIEGRRLLIREFLKLSLGDEFALNQTLREHFHKIPSSEAIRLDILRNKDAYTKPKDTHQRLLQHQKRALELVWFLTHPKQTPVRAQHGLLDFATMLAEEFIEKEGTKEGLASLLENIRGRYFRPEKDQQHALRLSREAIDYLDWKTTDASFHHLPIFIKYLDKKKPLVLYDVNLLALKNELARNPPSSPRDKVITDLIAREKTDTEWNVMVNHLTQQSKERITGLEELLAVQKTREEFRKRHAHILSSWVDHRGTREIYIADHPGGSHLRIRNEGGTEVSATFRDDPRQYTIWPNEKEWTTYAQAGFEPNGRINTLTWYHKSDHSYYERWHR